MKKNDSRAIARLKRMYREFKDNLFVRDGKKWRPCESITEFLELKWVKKLKNTGSIERHPLDKLDAKQKNRKERHSKKKIIEEGIQEYENRYDEYYCPQCMHCVEGYCVEKHKYVNDDDYCEDFFD
jgi:hypothetical protein